PNTPSPGDPPTPADPPSDTDPQPHPSGSGGLADTGAVAPVIALMVALTLLFVGGTMRRASRRSGAS
ncbi:hypothetical protein, partial [Microbacterium hydrocarbonoxydans]